MIRRIAALGIAFGLVLALGTPTVLADEMGAGGMRVAPAKKPVEAPPPPWVEIQRTSVALGVGLSWGDGTLLFEGERHPFSVKGLSVLDLGVARMIANGDVHNLARLSDFEGRYVAVEAGAAAVKGASAFSMRNQHGVVISLRSDVEGVALRLGAQGFQIAFE